MTVTDVLTDIGGLFSSLSLIGLAFNMTFSYNLLMSSLIRKLYHFKPKFEEEMQNKKKKKGDKNSTKTFADEPNDEDGYAQDSLATIAKNRNGGEYDGDESGEDDITAEMRPYTKHLALMHESSKRLFMSMNKTLGNGKAKFVFKTSGILKSLFCCRFTASREYLRQKNANSRQALYFLKGREMLDKEMDVAFIIRHVRILRYFLKTVLDKD